jgi:Ca-activated chloride channel family protein
LNVSNGAIRRREENVMTMNATTTMHPTNGESCGGRLVATDGRVLPLTRVRLTADAKGGLARAVLVQTFENVHPEPLQVTYQFPLPHAGAVSGFAFELGGKRIVGEVDLVRKARERFEEAILEGKTAALVEQQRGSVFVQEIGNVPPGALVEAELTVDQRLDWRDEGCWEWRFPTALAPRYQGGPGRVPDAAETAALIADRPIAPRLTLSLIVRDALAPGRRPESPSHEAIFASEGGALRATLAAEDGAPLDRDVVIRWPAAAPEVGVSLDLHRPSGGRLGEERAFGLLTVVPPAPERSPAMVARDLIVLLDTSGSMSGEPLDQARRVVGALIDSLGPRDRLELVEFSTEARRWRRGAAEATEANRREARRWLAGLQAAGGTEMREGIREALRGLRPEDQRQVVLVTDGLIGFESEVVAEILAELPPGSRLHTVGIGSSVNRSLTGPAARAGRGLEVVIGLGEDPERAAAALRSRTAAPLVTGLELAGSALVAHAPERLPDLFAGAPALAALELRPGGGTLLVRGRTAEGPFERRVEVRPIPAGAGSTALPALFAREAVEDLEMRLAAGEAARGIDRAVEQLGVDFQISTRLTSWVAVGEEATVDPARPTRRERMPQQLPHGMSIEGLGLRAPASPAIAAAGVLQESFAAAPAPAQSAKLRVRRTGAPGAPPPPRKKLIQVDQEDASATTEAAEPLKEAAFDRLARRLAAALRPVTSGRIVLEAQVTGGALEWDPPSSVKVVLDDGTERELEVDLAPTTAAGALAPGQTFRLVLRASPDVAPERLSEVVLAIGSGTLILDVAH